jgi:D-xylose 1-dehydrogenase
MQARDDSRFIGIKVKLMTQTIYGSLKGKTVLITGGASGIGESIARSFYAQGSKVAILDYNAEAGQALAKELGERVHFEHSDVRDIPAFQAAIRRASDAVGPITILVNNAARDDRHTIDQVTPEYWRERFATNLDHQFFAAQAVLPDMEKAGGGSIINMGSTSYMVSDDSFAAYKTAKSAAVGLTRALARELGPKNIRVNCVVPGWIMTQRQIDLWLTPEGEKELLKRQCVKRKLVPQDIANFTLFLGADDSSAMSAQTYLVDGGWV